MMKKNKNTFNNAFTLLEVLISISILTIVSASLFSFFYSGKKVYNSLNSKFMEYSNYQNFQIILGRDIKNLIDFQNVKFVLDANRMYFHLESKERLRNIYFIDYEVKKSIDGYRQLIRKEYVYPYDTNQEEDRNTKVLKDLNEIELKVKGIVNIQNDEESFEDEEKNRFVIKIFNKWKYDFLPISLIVSIKDKNNNNFYFEEYFNKQESYLNKIKTLNLTDIKLEKLEDNYEE